MFNQHALIWGIGLELYGCMYALKRWLLYRAMASTAL